MSINDKTLLFQLGHTALDYTSYIGHHEAGQLLLKMGAEVDIQVDVS